MGRIGNEPKTRASFEKLFLVAQPVDSLKGIPMKGRRGLKHLNSLSDMQLRLARKWNRLQTSFFPKLAPECLVVRNSLHWYICICVTTTTLVIGRWNGCEADSRSVDWAQ